MKTQNDSRTIDFFPIPRKRGRPVGDVPAMTAAQRQELRRSRLSEKGVGVLTVEISQEVLDALSAFVRFKDESKGSAVDRILRDRLLRKR